MSQFYMVEPEVAGGLGQRTVSKTSANGELVVSCLHYVLDGWLGDHLLESTPCFIATRQLAERLQGAGLSGFTTDVAEVTVSEQFRDLYGDRQLPEFVWLKVSGELGRADFAIAPDKRLVVSAAALSQLKAVGVAHAEIDAFPAASDDR